MTFAQRLALRLGTAALVGALAASGQVYRWGLDQGRKECCSCQAWTREETQLALDALERRLVAGAVREDRWRSLKAFTEYRKKRRQSGVVKTSP